MDIIKCLLGESDDAPEIKPDDELIDTEDQDTEPEPEPDVTEDSSIEELANMWKAGNHDDVARRFMQMDNETAVRTVFAIGREGSIILGRMVDDILERMGDHEGITPPPEMGGEDETSAEPLSVEPAAVEDDYPVKEITGQTGLGHKQDKRKLK